jgi:hypothetical protein
MNKTVWYLSLVSLLFGMRAAIGYKEPANILLVFIAFGCATATIIAWKEKP